MEILNKIFYRTSYILELNKSTIEEHICTAKTWAAHVDMLATALVFEVPVSTYFMQDSQDVIMESS